MYLSNKVSDLDRKMNSTVNVALKATSDIDSSPLSIIVRASTSGAGGRGFHPGLRHTKDVKMIPVHGYLATLLSAHHYTASTGFSSPKNTAYHQPCMSNKKMKKV